MDSINYDTLENYRNYEFVKKIVLDLPTDYQAKKGEIVELATEIGDDIVRYQINAVKINAIFNGLINSGVWKRRHVYLLCLDLIENYDTLYTDFDILPTELAKDLIAFHSTEFEPIRFYNEPCENLRNYIINYEWLRME